MKRIIPLLLLLTLLTGAGCAEGGMNLYQTYLAEGTAPSLCGYWAELFPVGTCLTVSQLRDEQAMAVVREHFSSVTCENEMKAEAVMNQAATRAAGDPERIQLRFTAATSILNWCRDNGKQVRAHCLVWHSQTPRWAFTVDYSDDGALADRETMLKRMENYIHDYMAWVNENYPGLVYAWDVVNEAIEPSNGHPRGLRTEKSLWYQTIGEDYILQAFTFARQSAAEGQKLYYNDYGCYDASKQVFIRMLLKELTAQGLVDGMGMQSHMDMDTPTTLDYEKAMSVYLALGIEVSVTELDIKTTDSSLAGQMRLAARYKSFFGMWRRLKKQAGKPIGGVTFWGFTDRHTWLSTRATPTYPLLFDAEYACKPAFFGAVMDASIPLDTSDAAITEAISNLGLSDSVHFVPENPDLAQVYDSVGSVPTDSAYAYPDSGAAWYQAVLKDSHLALGSNQRLKRVIEKAQAGEEVTIAVIGGSITEGAGAEKYSECWASRLLQGFRALWGAGDGSNVRLVNAGVGGTPSTFGWMRYQRDVVDRVTDADGLPDLVVIEFSVNDWGEPTGHRCYESMTRQILAQPNDPAVVLLFAVFESGFTLQDEMRAVGDACGLMMVSLRDSAYRQVGDMWTTAEFFYDEYHPTSMGHAVMADCILSALREAAARETDAADVSLASAPAFGDDYANLVTLYGTSDGSAYALSRGGFTHDDASSYTNYPVGRVCGPNFCHRPADTDEPLTFTAEMKNLLIAYRAVSDATYGDAEVWVDGSLRATLKANTGSWGQSVVDLIFAEDTVAAHTVEIRPPAGKSFTVTAIGFSTH